MCNFNILKVLFVCVADLRELLSAFSKRNDQDTLFEHGVMADAADTTLLSYRKKKSVVKNLHSKHNSREREMDNISILLYGIIVETSVTHFTEEVKVFHLFNVLADQCFSSPGSSP